ncbi:MAG: nucleoside deaminase [Deltaproteobacteria bacterium]|nr:nucleoside deaminase [Deltaproteobacteria bacterium]
MRRAIALADENVRSGRGGPFGAVVARDGVILGEGANAVTTSNDPTAHAEVVAIRNACRALGDFRLAGCEVYASCEPCPMCLGAVYWARLDRLWFAADRADAERAGFDDRFIYREIAADLDARRIPTARLLVAPGREVLERWRVTADKVAY